MTDEQDKRKLELRNKVYKLWTTTVKDNEIEPGSVDNLALMEAAVAQSIYQSNINELKEFLVDRNC